MNPDVSAYFDQASLALSHGWRIMGEGNASRRATALLHGQQVIENTLRGLFLAYEIPIPPDAHGLTLLQDSPHIPCPPHVIARCEQLLRADATAKREILPCVELSEEELRPLLCAAGELLALAEMHLPFPQTTPSLMPRLNIVVPMAGLGKRFADAGYTIPKPLIPVLGKPMYAWAVDSLPLNAATRLIFVLLRTMPGYDQLAADIWDRYAHLHPIILDVPELTRGQSESVLCARSLINSTDELLIHNADTAFDANPDWLADARNHQAEGALLVFPSEEPRWSYSRENSDGWVQEVREKQVISPWATTGTYWFAQGATFVRLAENSIANGKREGGEFYVGPLYTDLIAENGKVKNYPIQKLHCMGTPLELKEFLETYHIIIN